jgi:hypothetical protein
MQLRDGIPCMIMEQKGLFPVMHSTPLRPHHPHDPRLTAVSASVKPGNSTLPELNPPERQS